MTAELPDPRAVWSDDRDDVERNVRLAEEHAYTLEIAMVETAFDDDDAYQRAAAAFDEAYSLLVALQSRLMDLEDRDARAEERGLRGWHRWATS